MKIYKVLSSIVLTLLIVNTATAQGYVDQEAVRPIIENQTGDISQVKPVRWMLFEYQEYEMKDGRSIALETKDRFAELPGAYTPDQRMMIVEFANRVRSQFMEKGKYYLVPEEFPQDYRAYSPYPFHYPQADSMPKLFIIDKFTQTFAAYEQGKLVRWGIVSSGKSNTATPAGRYNFNWKTEYRQSNAAPEGETWHLYWVFNFYSKIGLHVHQYSIPIGQNVSHGCVRMIRADAQWNYEWANGWVRENGQVVRNGTPVIVINENPKGRPAHWNITEDGEVHSLVRLPDNFESIPTKTYAQKIAAWDSGW